MTSETPSQMTENFEGHQPSEHTEASTGSIHIPLDKIPTVMEVSPPPEQGEVLSSVVRMEMAPESAGVGVSTGPSVIVESEFGDFHMAAGQPEVTQSVVGTDDGKALEGARDAQQLSMGSSALHLAVQTLDQGKKEVSVEPTAVVAEQQSSPVPSKQEELSKKKKESSKAKKLAEEKGKKSKYKGFRAQLKDKTKGKAKEDIVDDAKLTSGVNEADTKSRKSICKFRG